jgi:hypothetical protein
MFGFGKTLARNRGGVVGAVLGGGSLQRAVIAGAGMLAMRWWRNRQASGRRVNPGAPTGSGYPNRRTVWSERA